MHQWDSVGPTLASAAVLQERKESSTVMLLGGPLSSTGAQSRPLEIECSRAPTLSPEPATPKRKKNKNQRRRLVLRCRLWGLHFEPSTQEECGSERAHIFNSP